MPYEVRTPVFEGPFDLFLHLIMREQVDLYEVSLSTIIDAYLLELDGFLQACEGRLDLEVATEFLLIAATLVELKCRRLLPGVADADLDDDLALWEERDLLLAKLLECKTFRDAAQALAHLSEEARRSFPRTAGLEDRFLDLTPDLLAGVTPAALRDAFLRAVAPKPVPTVDTSHLHVSSASVGEAMEELLDELPRAGRITFRRLTAGLVDRLEVVVRFLALLELFKQGLVDLDQAGSFGELVVVWMGDRGDDRARAEPLAVAAVDGYDG
ncbi:MAG: segregation/condensation protein A [Actinomycetota bacterium]|nr:segregation/condensation protein A [Actinomycetota bacterium]